MTLYESIPPDKVAGDGNTTKRELEVIYLKDYKTRSELHALFESKGLKKKSDEDVARAHQIAEEQRVLEVQNKTISTKQLRYLRVTVLVGIVAVAFAIFASNRVPRRKHLLMLKQRRQQLKVQDHVAAATAPLLVSRRTNSNNSGGGGGGGIINTV